MSVSSLTSQQNVTPATCGHENLQVMPDGKAITQSKKITCIFPNDQSAFKGFFWGAATVNFGLATSGLSAMTILTARFLNMHPLDLEDYAGNSNIATLFRIAPIAFGALTALSASLTSKCYANAAFHFGPRKIVIVQTS